MDGMVLVLDVGGTRFTLKKDTVYRGPVSRLTRVFEEGIEEMCQGEITPVSVDRPAEIFAAILAFYQTGELHMPPSTCPGAFVKELEFWSISPDCLTTCCQIRLQNFYADQSVVREFQNSIPSTVDQTDGQTDGSMESPSDVSCFERVRRRLWRIVDNREKSFVAKFYFIIVVTMVILSIVALGISTEPSFQRLMDNCERIEYMKSTEMENIDIAARILGVHRSCERNDSNSNSANNRAPYMPQNPFYSNDENEYSFEYVYWNPREPLSNDTSTGPVPTVLTYYRGFFIKIPNMKIPMYWFVIVEALTTAFFTIDLLLRLASCPSLIRYFRSIINIADALALVGTYAHMVLVSNDYGELINLSAIDLLMYLQVLRSLRLIRVARQFKLYRILAYSLIQNIRDLFILGLLVFICMSVYGSLAYLAEKTENGLFRSIPQSWYWALITLTTVGYGDISPKTCAGRVIASVCAVSGVILFAMTIPIFVNNFMNLYQIATGNIGKKIKTSGLSIENKQNAINRQSSDNEIQKNGKDPAVV